LLSGTPVIPPATIAQLKAEGVLEQECHLGLFAATS
jgi:hypothetical protein